MYCSHGPGRNRDWGTTIDLGEIPLVTLRIGTREIRLLSGSEFNTTVDISTHAHDPRLEVKAPDH